MGIFDTKIDKKIQISNKKRKNISKSKKKKEQLKSTWKKGGRR